MIDQTTYNALRAICDKADAYWKANATFDRSGWSSLPAGKAAHPDYAACTNDMRGQVEAFELNRDKPEKFSAYVNESTSEQVYATTYIACRRRDLTTWTGHKLGVVTYTGPWHRNNFGGKWRAIDVRTVWGDRYYGREYDSRQLVNLTRSRAKVAA